MSTQKPTSSAEPLTNSEEQFTDRRGSGPERKASGFERRQFSNSYSELSEEAADLGRAVDAYKLEHRRRFISVDELLSVIKSLGYKKQG